MENKKIIIPAVIILLLVIGGVLYWNNQQEMANLNENLPEGVRVIKTLFGDYKVVNKIDDYEFTVPDEWKGIKNVYYTAERTETGYVGTSIELEGTIGPTRILFIDLFKTTLLNVDLEKWAGNFFKTFNLNGNFSKDKIGNFEVVKTTEDVHLAGMYVYFFEKDTNIYTITNGSEEFIREIIVSGKW